MADEAASGGAGSGQAGGSLLISDMSVLLMDDVLHKLHCLDYESQYCAPKDIVPFHALYFATPASHSGLQFSHFLSIATFLLAKCRRPFAIEKLEDPTSVLTRLVNEVRTMGYQDPSPDSGAGPQAQLQPLRLRSGHGEAVVRLLNFLCDKALEAIGWHFDRPNYSEVGGRGGGFGGDSQGAGGDGQMIAEDGALMGMGDDGTGGGGVLEENDDGDDGDEITEKDVLRTGAGGGGDDDEGGDGDDDGLGGGDRGSDDAAGGAGGKAGCILESTVDPVQWRAEVERAGTRLKAPTSLAAAAAAGAGGGIGGALGGGAGVALLGIGATGSSVGGSSREWRSHLEQTHAAEASIETMVPSMQGGLDKLALALNDVLTSISNKEKFLNASFKAMAGEYQSTASALEEVNGSYQAASTRVARLTADLNSMAEALEETKQLMEEKGSSMTDTSPLIKVKAALSALRQEIKTLDLHLGVVGHAVLNSKISHKRQPGDAHGLASLAGISVGKDGAGGGKKSALGGSLNSSFSKAEITLSDGDDEEEDDDGAAGVNGSGLD